MNDEDDRIRINDKSVETLVLCTLHLSPLRTVFIEPSILVPMPLPSTTYILQLDKMWSIACFVRARTKV